MVLRSSRPVRRPLPTRATPSRRTPSRWVLGLWAALAAAAAGAAPPASDGWAPGRVLVQTRAGVSDVQIKGLAAGHGGQAQRIGRSNLFMIDLPAHASETAVQAMLARHPLLKSAELDHALAPALVTNDPYLGSQWHLPRIGAPTAWESTNGSGIVIAILDSGILSTHPDLASVLTPGWNFIDSNSDLTDVTGHGTLIAGAAAAAGNNGVGVAGVATAARIMPLRVATTTGTAYYSTVARAVTYAADRGARVANVSYSGVYRSASVKSAADYLRAKGGLVVVAAGNTGADDGSPATPAMIPVSATDGNDARAGWSSFGNYVAVAAPGTGIWTTNRSGGYTASSGTSLSAPVVAGTIALMMAANPALSATQIENLLYSTAVDLGSAGRDIYFGHGRIDAAAAVAAAQRAVPDDGTPPSVAIANVAAGASVSGLVNVDISAFDNVGVTKVDLLVNGKVVASDVSGPYQLTWDSATVPNGTATLGAMAYDAAGNHGVAANVGITVSNAAVADVTPPQVVVNNPANGSRISGNVTVSVSASDNAGNAALKQWLYIDGALATSATGAVLTYRWNTNKVAAGSHTLTAVAQDAAGNRTSTQVTVTR